MIRALIVLSLTYFCTVYGSTSQCSITDVDTILQGCGSLKGLNVISTGGTVVNDQNCGILVPKQTFVLEPLFKYKSADRNKFYTLLLVDPDAPPAINGQFYLHLLKFNVPGSALISNENSTPGTDYKVYQSPAPLIGTGAHRYISLLYEQADGQKFRPKGPLLRPSFDLADWLQKQNLCGPVAGTLFLATF